MKYLIYMSSATQLMSNDELLELLKVSRENNTKKNLTGMLLYGEGAFVQVLEGEDETVDSTYDIIKADPRHKSIIQIISGKLEKRNFPEWSMGFKAVDRKIAEEFTGFIDIRNDGLLIEDEKHPAIIVLKTFADANNLA
ncbi:BLUF domain-containing protein [Mucilaginibacter jinjuensis]|uniref:BLUF domain-containing protein n=1 Tax=Mucilaginibacter jinjuensis TaxID=1176721 RepID=A0ABY7TB92_9SPHI|nr:BLUF domain-containing protein [Mucilaginibacter jinjuensis]WCT13206.1 BLUF domain-containing protein [Mucilaginibacter jinjuensis]